MNVTTNKELREGKNGTNRKPKIKTEEKNTRTYIWYVGTYSVRRKIMSNKRYAWPAIFLLLYRNKSDFILKGANFKRKFSGQIFRTLHSQNH